jgi:outer membrane immunogenic protein
VRRLITVGCLCALALALCSVSQAQSKDPFNGFYVGGYAGGTFGTMVAHTTTVFSPTGYFNSTSPGAIAIAGAQNVAMRGFNGGGQIGYSYSQDHFMVGVEFDFGSLRLTGTQSSTGVYPCCSPSTFTVKQTGTSKWMATLRPRVGYVRGHFLYYGTFGAAMADLNYRAVFTDTFSTGAAENGGITKNKWGWVGGGGVEYSFGRHWSVKGEYLYAHFQSETALSTNLITFGGTTLSPQNFFVHSANLQAHIVRGGINYTF